MKEKKAPKTQFKAPVAARPSSESAFTEGKIAFNSRIFNLRGDLLIANLAPQLSSAGFRMDDEVHVTVERIKK